MSFVFGYKNTEGKNVAPGLEAKGTYRFVSLKTLLFLFDTNYFILRTQSSSCCAVPNETLLYHLTLPTCLPILCYLPPSVYACLYLTSENRREC